ncbi:MAG: hypothetical protein L6V80_03900 [Bacteroidales bacterium]|nr:MAG: hypothetical protein L6V80_03900 [Bacteroidales bacterium]
MYRHNDISITPMLSFQRSQNSAPDWGDNSLTRAAMSNVGAVLNLYEGASSHVVSFSVGIAYNRVADFNYNYGYSSSSAPSSSPYRSIADAFSRMMGQSRLFPSDTGSLNYGYGDAYFWGGILAYNAFLLDVGTDEYGDYWTTAGRLGVNAGVGHTVNEQSRGSIGEYDLSFGMNIDNLVYVGATLGAQDVDWRRQLYYGEDYLYNGQTPVASDGTPLQNPAQWMDYNQAIKVSGTGINLKLGVIVRPTDGLRLGMAIHTPTYYILNRKYQAYMASNFNDRGDTTPSLEDVSPYTWDFVSPTRLMFGASYTFGKMAVISVDYERDWYNGIRARGPALGIRPLAAGLPFGVHIELQGLEYAACGCRGQTPAQRCAARRLRLRRLDAAQPQGVVLQHAADLSDNMLLGRCGLRHRRLHDRSGIPVSRHQEYVVLPLLRS